MAIIYDSNLSPNPDDVTEFIRNVPVNSSLQFFDAFGRIETDDNAIDWTEITRTNRVAKYRSYDGRIHVSERDGGAMKRVPLIPLSTSLSKGEFEALQLEFARNGSQDASRLMRAAYNDAEQLTREVQNRLELAWGDLLTDGKLTISENGYAGETDYGLAALGNLVIPAGDPWTNTADAVVLTDLQVWNDAYRAQNGKSAGQLKTSQSRRRLALRNKQVIDAVHGSTAGHTRVTLTQLNELLEGEGLPTFSEPYDTSLDVDGVSTRVLPENRVLFMPADDNLDELGATAWGVTATALELVNSMEADMSFEEAAGIVGVVLKLGPPFREFVYVDAVAMPVLTNARALMVANVG